MISNTAPNGQVLFKENFLNLLFYLQFDLETRIIHYTISLMTWVLILLETDT